MIILFLLSFAFPRSSSELAHSLAPVVIQETAYQLAGDIQDLGHVKYSKFNQRIISMLAADLTLLIVNQFPFYNHHYSTGRENNLQLTGWSIWNGARFGVMLIKIPLKI
jgi:hypothetical protein